MNRVACSNPSEPHHLSVVYVTEWGVPLNVGAHFGGIATDHRCKHFKREGSR